MSDGCAYPDEGATYGGASYDEVGGSYPDEGAENGGASYDEDGAS